MKRDTEVSTELEKKYGGRSILVCDCFWSTEDWILFGLQEYPHLESVQEVTRALREVNFFSYFESRIILGTPGIPLEIAEPGSSEIDYQPYQRTDKPGNQLPIMKLYMMKPKASWFRLTPEQKTQIHLAEAEVTKATEKKYGFKSLIVCDCFWSTEDWAAFGVEEHPNVESVQESTRALRSFGWFKYIESQIILGVPEIPLELPL